MLPLICIDANIQANACRDIDSESKDQVTTAWLNPRPSRHAKAYVTSRPPAVAPPRHIAHWLLSRICRVPSCSSCYPWTPMCGCPCSRRRAWKISFIYAHVSVIHALPDHKFTYEVHINAYAEYWHTHACTDSHIHIHMHIHLHQHLHLHVGIRHKHTHAHAHMTTHWYLDGRMNNDTQHARGVKMQAGMSLSIRAARDMHMSTYTRTHGESMQIRWTCMRMEWLLAYKNSQTLICNINLDGKYSS